jgi:hypothetical protein
VGGSPKPGTQKPTAKQGEGEPQIDYVRRLAEQMKADSHQFQAIGIVGSDVYDKLLLLKALRPSFPNAVFFTTDLDVRLLQPGDYADTRNLLIASHYGLSLRDDLQGKVSPFRSSYDTASYLGCLQAAKYRCKEFKETLKKEERPVHLYEVARSGAYELSLRDGDTLGPENPRHHPELLRGYRPLCLICIAVLALFLLCPASRPCQRVLQAAWSLVRLKARRLDWIGGLVAAGLVVLLSLLICSIYCAHTTEGEEPFELFEGISTWPTVAFRLLATGLCVFYVLRVILSLGKRDARVVKEFKFTRPPGAYLGEDIPYLGEVIQGIWNPFREIWLALVQDHPGRRIRGLVDAVWKSWQTWVVEPDAKADISELYQKFAEQGVPLQRLVRSLSLTVLTMPLFMLIWCYFYPTTIQSRGTLASIWYFWVTLATLFASTFLLMFVLDSTLLSYRFVRAIQGERKWPEDLLDEKAKGWAFPEPHADLSRRAVAGWLSLRLIDAVTNVVAGQLIYYPFVVLLVLVVSQNSLFDDWHWNPALIWMAVLYAGAAVACAVLLQRAAKKARDQALAELDEMIHGIPPGDGLAENLTRVRSEVEGLKTGAFSGLYQNPVVGAVLLPLCGGGGLAALEALLSYFAHP